MSPESAAQKALICGAICATKERLRLAQSILRQPFEQIGFLGRFSRLLKADSGACKKRDSRVLFSVGNHRISPVCDAGSGPLEVARKALALAAGTQ